MIGLVRNHEAAAFRTAYLITGNASEAEDAAQEAFVKAYGVERLAARPPDAGYRCPLGARLQLVALACARRGARVVEAP